MNERGCICINHGVCNLKFPFNKVFLLYEFHPYTRKFPSCNVPILSLRSGICQKC